MAEKKVSDFNDPFLSEASEESSEVGSESGDTDAVSIAQAFGDGGDGENADAFLAGFVPQAPQTRQVVQPPSSLGTGRSNFMVQAPQAPVTSQDRHASEQPKKDPREIEKKHRTTSPAILFCIDNRHSVLIDESQDEQLDMILVQAMQTQGRPATFPAITRAAKFVKQAILDAAHQNCPQNASYGGWYAELPHPGLPHPGQGMGQGKAEEQGQGQVLRLVFVRSDVLQDCGEQAVLEASFAAGDTA